MGSSDRSRYQTMRKFGTRDRGHESFVDVAGLACSLLGPRLIRCCQTTAAMMLQMISNTRPMIMRIIAAVLIFCFGFFPPFVAAVGPPAGTGAAATGWRPATSGPLGGSGAMFSGSPGIGP